MSEGVEFRVKSSGVNIQMLGGAILYFVGVVALGLSTAMPQQSLRITVATGGAFMVLLSVLVWMDCMAEKKDGYCRYIFEILGFDYPDPPLDEWEESLEERGAFEVNYDHE